MNKWNRAALVAVLWASAAGAAEPARVAEGVYLRPGGVARGQANTARWCARLED